MTEKKLPEFIELENDERYLKLRYASMASGGYPYYEVALPAKPIMLSKLDELLKNAWRREVGIMRIENELELKQWVQEIQRGKEGSP